MALDNRDKNKNKTLEEIENDNNPINENEPAKDPEETPEEEQGEEQETPENAEGQDEGEENDEGQGEDEGEPEAPVTPPAKPETPKDEEEQRYREQRNESVLLNQRNESLISNIDKASQLPEPTQEELEAFVRARGATWEELTPFEQNMAKESLMDKRKFDTVYEGIRDIKQIDEWAKKVKGFTDDNQTKQTFKGLIGKEDAFMSFALQPTHRGIAFETLVPAFLFSASSRTPLKRSLLNTQGGGTAPEPPKKGLDDADEVAKLRQSNPKEYARKLKSGEIKIEV